MTRAQRIGFLLGPALFAGIALWPLPDAAFSTAIARLGIEDPAGQLLLRDGIQSVLAVAALMVVWWVTEAVPIPVTALLPGVLFPLMRVHGVVGDSVVAFTSRSAFTPYAHPVVYLFLAGFIIAIALSKHGLDRRFTLRLLTLGDIARHPHRVVGALMLATALLSMWISDTAATAMMLPLALGVTNRLAHDTTLDTAALLSIAWAALIGGVATPIGTPPNGIAIGMLDQQGIASIGFLDWMRIGLPVTVILLPAGWLLIVRIFRLRGMESSGDEASALLHRERAELGPWRAAELRTLIVFGATAFLWVSRPFWGAVVSEESLAALAGWDIYEIGLLAALTLFILPAESFAGPRLVAWTDAREIDWGTLILFGGGLALSAGMFQTGAAHWLVHVALAVVGTPSAWLLIAVAALLVNYLTEITSNTATTSMMVPILIAVALELGHGPLAVVVAVALSASMAFMLPVATPPNALVYGTGRVPIGTMIRAGFRMNLLGWLAIVTTILVLL